MTDIIIYLYIAIGGMIWTFSPDARHAYRTKRYGDFYAILAPTVLLWPILIYMALRRKFGKGQ